MRFETDRHPWHVTLDDIPGHFCCAVNHLLILFHGKKGDYVLRHSRCPPQKTCQGEVIAEYLTAALQDSNPDVFLSAVGNVAKARGMTAIAESTGLGRESLYKAFAPGAKPRYDTVLKVLQSFGVKLNVSA